MKLNVESIIRAASNSAQSGEENIEIFKSTKRGFILSEDVNFLFLKSLCMSYTEAASRADLIDVITILNLFNLNVEFLGRYGILNIFSSTRDEPNRITVCESGNVATLDIISPVYAIITPHFSERIRDLAYQLFRKENVGLLGLFHSKRSDEEIKSEFLKIKFHDKAVEHGDYRTASSERSMNQGHSNVLNRMEILYDVDAIFGMVEIDKLVGIRKDIHISFNLLNTRSTRSKEKIKIDSSFIKISSLINYSLGTIHISENMEMKLFMVTNKTFSSYTSIRLDMMKLMIKREIEDFFSESASKSAINPLVKTFKRENNFIEGSVKPHELVKLMKKIRSRLESQVCLYIECFGCKSAINDVSLYKITDKISEILDLNTISPKLDLCANVNFKDLLGKTLYLEKSFIRDVVGVNKYKMLNDEELYSFHGKVRQFKPSKIHEKMHIRANGISKLNFYTPIICNYFSRDLRTRGFPSYSANLLFERTEGLQVSKVSARMRRKIKKKLLDVQRLIENSFIINNGIRLEVTTDYFNIYFFEELVEKLISNASFIPISTDTINEKISHAIDLLVNKAFANEFPNFEEISKLAVFEIIFNEFFIRGGWNKHILPATLSGRISRRDYRSEWSMSEYSNMELSRLEVTHLINNLVNYNKTPPKDAKAMVLKLYDITILRSLNIQGERLYEYFVADVCKLLKKKPSELTERCKNVRHNDYIPIPFESLFTHYFLDFTDRRWIYIAIYRYLTKTKGISQQEVSNQIYSSLRRNNIKFFFVREKGQKTKYRKISFNNMQQEDAFLKDIKFIRACIVNTGAVNKNRDQEFSISEKILLKVGLSYDSYASFDKNGVYNDIRYIFFFYCKLDRLRWGYKKLDTSKNVSKMFFKSLCMGLKINSLRIDQIVQFLNTNLRRVTDVDAIRRLDRLLCLEREQVYEEKSELYYSRIFEGQTINKSKHQDYKFLFNELMPYSTEGKNFISVFHDRDADDSGHYPAFRMPDPSETDIHASKTTKKICNEYTAGSCNHIHQGNSTFNTSISDDSHDSDDVFILRDEQFYKVNSEHLSRDKNSYSRDSKQIISLEAAEQHMNLGTPEFHENVNSLEAVEQYVGPKSPELYLHGSDCEIVTGVLMPKQEEIVDDIKMVAQASLVISDEAVSATSQISNEMIIELQSLIEAEIPDPENKLESLERNILNAICTLAGKNANTFKSFRYNNIICRKAKTPFTTYISVIESLKKKGYIDFAIENSNKMFLIHVLCNSKQLN